MIPRVNDPATHESFPESDWKWKLGNFFLEKWGRKFIFKLLQIIQPFVQVVVGHLAHTEASSQLIGAAIGAAVLGGLDVVISYVTHGKVQSLQKIQEEAEADEEAEPETEIIPHLSLGQLSQTVDRVPPRTWVSEIDIPGPLKPRRYFGSLAEAVAFGLVASKSYPQADINIHEPGDILS